LYKVVVISKYRNYTENTSRAPTSLDLARSSWSDHCVGVSRYLYGIVQRVGCIQNLG
jgi:hypothetical protein